ncbi:MAG TPA: hypothetical protein VID05_02930, partial [Acidimicrobiales bacterium]
MPAGLDLRGFGVSRSGNARDRSRPGQFRHAWVERRFLMSVGSPELDRSVLEGKDRDELVTIATALGEKPPARAKKADIIDLVLRLTGADVPSGPAPDEAAADDKPKARRAPRARAAA